MRFAALLEKSEKELDHFTQIAEKDQVKKSGLRWNIWQIELGLFKGIKDGNFIEIVKRERSKYEKLLKEMRSCIDAYEDHLMDNPLLQTKEEVV